MSANPETIFLNSSQVRHRYGDCSHMALIRWMEDRGFPAPVYFGRKRFWKLEELDAWERSQAAQPHKREKTGFARGAA